MIYRKLNLIHILDDVLFIALGNALYLHMCAYAARLHKSKCRQRETFDNRSLLNMSVMFLCNTKIWLRTFKLSYLS